MSRVIQRGSLDSGDHVETVAHSSAAGLFGGGQRAVELPENCHDKYAPLVLRRSVGTAKKAHDAPNGVGEFLMGDGGRVEGLEGRRQAVAAM